MCFKIIFWCFVLHLVKESTENQIRNEEEDPYCYSRPEQTIPQHSHFTTKTEYGLVKGILQEPETVPECEPVRMWLLARHGTVYPLDFNVEIETLKKLNESFTDLDPNPLCPTDRELLKAWDLNANIAQYPDQLTQEGKDQMKTLAEEYRRAFPLLFDTANKVMFRHTAHQRNKESYQEFAKALFGADQVNVNSSLNPLLLEFYNQCDKWNETNEQPLSNFSQYEKSDEFKNTLDEISVRLGITSDNKWEIIKNVWDMCRIDKALETVENLSPWCIAFTEEHVNVLEYHDDIELYYKTGHGEDINSRLACKTIDDLINHFGSSVDSPKTIVSFADATAVQLFITALGTHADAVDPSNVTIVPDRMWKSSKMSPFASNVAVVKYDCGTSAAKVKLFLNQNLLKPKWDWCTSDGVCGFDEFIKHYSNYTSADCDKYFCDYKTSGVSKITNGVGMFVVAVSMIFVYLL